MKIFIFACGAFALSALIILFSSLYVAHALTDTTDSLNALPAVIESAEEKTPDSIIGCLDDIYETWRRRTGVLSLFINHKELEEIEALLVTLRASVISSDDGHYASSLASLRERIDKLSSSEKFSICVIL